MRTKYVITILNAVLLSACNGGGDDSPAPGSSSALTGTFVDSPVSGLAYTTETQSGLTNELGEFRYNEGETVTFSIGNTVLGLAPGDDVITPFDLTGIKALDAEIEIINSLRSSTANSYDRAINIAALLQTLDKDGNPDNGIDLAEADSTLSDLSIPLFVKALAFENQVELTQAKSELGITRTRDFGATVKHLYSSLDIEISSQHTAQQVSKSNWDLLESISFEYTTDGKVASRSTDENNDGEADITQIFDYDAQGNLTSINNTSTQTLETLDYNDQSNLVSRFTDNDSAPDLEESYDYLNDKLERFELDRGADGTVDSATQYSYGADGQLSGYELDKDGDNLADSVASFSYENNEVSRYTEDSNNDGSPNTIIAYTYDTQGNRLAQNISHDIDGTEFTTSKFKYDANNHPIRYEVDQNQDGTPEYIESYQNNKDGQRTVYKRDNEGDGVWDFVAQYFYDINGNRIRMIEDSDGNGIVDKTWEADFQAAVLDNSWDIILGKL